MNYIENIYICLAAPLILAILCLQRETGRSLVFLTSGMTACLISAYVSTFFASLTGTDALTASYEIAPAVEEVVKFLPLLFYILVFEPEKRNALSGAMFISIGFATFENVCFLTSYGISDLLRLTIRGFGTGAMHVVCGMAVAVGLFFLWEKAWLRTVGVFALLCFVVSFHGVFNILVNQSGVVFWIGSAIPLAMIAAYVAFLRKTMVRS
ncbi:MAG: PrsW family intramembrane metalloprotease [Eubacteriales bacterium]|nr:PrsW family intramembrane metalloprotease [Eubacteriales bacterium]